MSACPSGSSSASSPAAPRRATWTPYLPYWRRRRPICARAASTSGRRAIRTARPLWPTSPPGAAGPSSHEGRVAGYECVSMQPEECYRGIDGPLAQRGRELRRHTPRHGGAEFRHTLALARDVLARGGPRRRNGEAERARGHPPRQPRDEPALRELGYQFCGVVDLSSVDPAHDSLRNAYEKLV